jgi:hypothetical protein
MRRAVRLQRDERSGPECNAQSSAGEAGPEVISLSKRLSGLRQLGPLGLTNPAKPSKTVS